MKLNQAEKTFESNAEVESQDFTIGDVSVVIEILRNKLYRRKIPTLCQEYISNARDAMREVNNNKDRIEVTLPSTFAPTFKVRDFGPGISPDRMYNVFIKYASSTKRTTNKQTGGFGIGAKSAWSYTESFSIVTYIDGTQRNYVAHIGANNNGRLDYLGDAPSSEANGTEIQIPVSPKDIQEFKTAAFRATYFWREEEKPKFVNLHQIDKDQTLRVQGEMIGNIEINNELPSYILPSDNDTSIVASIDGIPYMIDSSLIEKLVNLGKLHDSISGQLVIHVPNGELEVSASREEISDSKFTQDNLDKLAAKYHKIVLDRITKEFGSVKSPFEYLSTYMKLKDKYNLEAHRKYGDFTMNEWDGIESDLLSKITMELCTFKRDRKGTGRTDLQKENQTKPNKYSWSRKPSIRKEWFNKMFFIDGTEEMIITNYRIKDYLSLGNDKMIVFSKRDDDAGQFDKLVTALGLKDLKTQSFTKPVRQAKAKIVREKQSFIIHRMDRYSSRMLSVTLESNKQKWLFVLKDVNTNVNNLKSLNDYLQQTEDYKICALSHSAMKLVKGDANFKPLDKFLEKYKASKSDMSVLKKEVSKNMSLMQYLSKVSGIKDKFLNKMVDEYKEIIVESGKRNGGLGYNVYMPDEIRKIIGKSDELEQFKTDDKTLIDTLKNYPLLGAIGGDWNKLSTDIALYINSK